jgi:hypothetical protein
MEMMDVLLPRFLRELWARIEYFFLPKWALDDWYIPGLDASSSFELF